eukprot:748176-Hanusia_phi.AAC.1
MPRARKELREDAPSPLTPAKLRASRGSRVMGKPLPLPPDKSMDKENVNTQDMLSRASLLSQQSTVRGSDACSLSGFRLSDAHSVSSVGDNRQDHSFHDHMQHTRLSQDLEAFQQEMRTPQNYRSHDGLSLQTIKESIKHKQEISSRLFDSPNSPEKHQALEEQLRAIKAEEDALNTLHAELKQALNDCTSSSVKSAQEMEIEVIREQIRELHGALEKEKEKTNALSLQVSAGSEEAEKIRQELFKAEEYSKQVKDEAQKASEKQDKHYEQAMLEKDLEIDRLQMVVQELEQDIEKLNKTVEDRESEIESCKLSISEKDTKIEQLKEAVKHTQESLLAFRDEVAKLQLQNRNVSESSQEELNDLRSRLKESETASA